ncbi:MAG TPA: hypothetical protein HPP94_10875 [Desulfuromonadales bacterium]|nr:hypothetical protein [Desulfuromonadales bacterium]
MRVIRIVFVVMIMIIPSLCAAETSAQKEIGRYQLFQGTFTTLDLKYRQASSTHNAVFLIDTVTGVVKRYVNRIDEDGRYIETWLTTELTQQMDVKKIGLPQPEGK